MSLPDPRLNNVEKRKPAPAINLTGYADTNLVLQKTVQQLPQNIRNTIILRCDELARLRIDEAILEDIVSQILGLITEAKEPETKLFLHITCSKEKKQEKEKTSGLNYQVQFHTNLTPLAGRFEEAELRMNKILAMLIPFEGNLTVTQLKNSGSVFCMTLPGK